MNLPLQQAIGRWLISIYTGILMGYRIHPWDIHGMYELRKIDKGLSPSIIWAKLFGTWSFRISFGIHQVSYYLLVGRFEYQQWWFDGNFMWFVAMLIHAYTIFGGDEYPQIPTILVRSKRYQGFDGPEASCQFTRWYFPSQKMEGWSLIKGIQKPECPLF